jgi:hypothetical protein
MDRTGDGRRNAVTLVGGWVDVGVDLFQCADLAPAVHAPALKKERLAADAHDADQAGAQGEGAVFPVVEVRVEPAEHRFGERAAVGAGHRGGIADVGADGDVGQADVAADPVDLPGEVHHLVHLTGRQFCHHVNWRALSILSACRWECGSAC